MIIKQTISPSVLLELLQPEFLPMFEFCHVIWRIGNSWVTFILLIERDRVGLALTGNHFTLRSK